MMGCMNIVAAYDYNYKMNKIENQSEIKWILFACREVAHTSLKSRSFSLEAPYTLLAMFPALGLGQLGCAGCASSPACSVWWCVGAGPPDVQSRGHALPRQMPRCLPSLRHACVHSHAASGTFLSDQRTLLDNPCMGLSTPLLSIPQLGLGLWDALTTVGEFSWGKTLLSLPGGSGHV